MRTALVCIAKNEDIYLEEWVKYNLKIGFDHIYIYMNDWRTDFEHPNVTKIPFDGPVKQLIAYNSFRVSHKDQYDWVAYFDCDEFLCLKKHKSVKELIKAHQNANAIAINWFMFGSDNVQKRKGKSLLKLFTKRNKDVNHHVKVIVNMNVPSIMVLPHNIHLPMTDTNGKEFNGPFNPKGPTDVCYLAHYHRKTYEDWLNRCERGRADCNLSFTPEQWLESINEDVDVIDTSVRDFLYVK
jgi:hypothetical protein